MLGDVDRGPVFPEPSDDGPDVRDRLVVGRRQLAFGPGGDVLESDQRLDLEVGVDQFRLELVDAEAVALGPPLAVGELPDPFGGVVAVGRDGREQAVGLLDREGQNVSEHRQPADHRDEGGGVRAGDPTEFSGRSGALVAVDDVAQRAAETADGVERIGFERERAEVGLPAGHRVPEAAVGELLAGDGDLFVAQIAVFDLVASLGQPAGVPAGAAAGVEDPSRLGEPVGEVVGGVVELHPGHGVPVETIPLALGELVVVPFGVQILVGHPHRD